MGRGRFTLAMRYLLCVSGILFLLVAFCESQTTPRIQARLAGWTYHAWDIADGLPDQAVESLALASNGYLWLGTPHGLARFDGATFEASGAWGATSLHDHGVASMLVSKGGDFWIGSIGGGITRISHGVTQHFDGDDGPFALSVRALYEDDAGGIWAVTGHGIYRREKDRFVRDETVGDETLTSITADGAGGFWVGGTRLFHYSLGRFTPFPLLHQRENVAIRGLALTEGKRLWIGTADGLLSMEPSGAISKDASISGTVRAVCSDFRGWVWVGTAEDGLIVHKPDGSEFLALGPEERMSKSIRTISVTPGGDVWLGTTAGLVRLSQTGMSLIHLSTTAGNDFGSLFVDADNSVWLGAGTLARVSHGVPETISLPQQIHAPIRAFYRDSTNMEWIGTIGEGSYRVGPSGVQHLPEPQLVRAFRGGAEAGTVWIASDQGLWCWRQGRMSSFVHLLGSPPGAIRAMTLAGDGTVWLGAADGLFQFDGRQYVSSTLTKSFAHQRIWALYFTPGGSLWISAESGFFVFQHARLFHILLPNLPTGRGAVLSVLEDTLGRVLIAQPTDILRVDRVSFDAALQETTSHCSADVCEASLRDAPETFAIGRESGAELYGTLPSIAQADSSGGAWFAAYSGLIHIEPERVVRSDSPPPIMISKVTVDGVDATRAGTLKLSPSTRNTNLQVSVIRLTSHPGLNIRGRLEGLQKDWTPLGAGSTFVLSELPPGQYTFRVEARWNDSPLFSSAELRITQQAPFYRTPAFIVLCCSLLAFVIWGSHRIRVHELQSRFQAVEEERRRVAREMHDTLIQGCIGVSSLLEAASSGEKKARRSRQFDTAEAWLSHLDYAREQIKQTIQEARITLWDLRQPGSTLGIAESIEEMLKGLEGRSEAQLILDASGPAVKLSPRVHHEVRMAVREAVLNAVLHSKAQTICVEVDCTETGSLSIRIVDDGTGFNLETTEAHAITHFGIQSMKQRIAALGGSTKVQSILLSGTRVELHIRL